MAPKKRLRIGQEANTTPGLVVDPLLNNAGEDNPPTTTLPDSFTIEQTTPVPTPTKGATIPRADIPAPPIAPAPSPGISDRDLRGAIQMLTQLVASQAQRSNVAPTSFSLQGDSFGSRVNRFLQLDPLVFIGTDPGADPQDFIDEMHKTLRVMRATEMEGVELASYRLNGVAYSWFEFLLAEIKAARAVEFETLKQGIKNVWEYHVEFVRLSKYVVHMMPTMEARVRRFVQGLSPLVINEAATTSLNSDMNYGRMVVFAKATEAQKLKLRMEHESSSRARSAGNLGNSFGGGRLAFRGGSSGPSQSYAQSSASAPPSGHGQGSRGSHHHGRLGGQFQQQYKVPCPKCGRRHSGVCYLGMLVCYGCEMRGHIQRECRVSRQGAGRGTAQSSSPTATISSAPPPARGSLAPTGCGTARGGAQSS
ncbi:uncharacterized protein [Nicotiana tomentosiformis]|uniref:uncharacterized protein n=1 Tax=Nicotiana tomentosiformis TaxID=4098 RepID=UPI00388C3BD2